MGRITDALTRARNESKTAPDQLAREPSWDLPTLVSEPSPPAPPSDYPTEPPMDRASDSAPVGPSTKQTPIGDTERQKVPEAIAERLATNPSLPQIAREQHRRLAAELHRERLTAALKAVMITSARPGDGKTLTAANLALTLSESFNETVLLIDADLRDPTLHQVFGVKVGQGLSEVLTGGDPRLLQAGPRLSLLLSGKPTDDPLKLFASAELRAVMTTAREGFDWVIVDTPPVAMPETPVIATLMDVALFVVAAGTDYRAAQEAISNLGLERVGVVLNRVTERDFARQSYGSYYDRTPGSDG